MRIDSVAADLGLRYAFARGSSLSLIGNIAICGLALSIAVLVVVVSVINGFERELERRVFAVLPHLSLHGWEPLSEHATDLELLESLPGVRAAVPFVQAVGLAAGADKVQGMLLTGILPQGYQRVSAVGRYVHLGNDSPVAAGSPAQADAVPVAAGLDGLRPGAFRVVLGARLAARLGAQLGDRVTLVLPSATITPAGAFPRQKRFEVVGLLQSHSELDSRAVFVHLADAQRLLRLGGQVHGYQVRLEDFFAAGQAGRDSLAALGQERFYARSWMRSHGNLYRAIRVQKTTMFVLLAFLVGVAAFNLVSTLVMAVEQRGADIAILKTMGVDTGSLMAGFILLGTLIGGLGILAGIAVGCLAAAALPLLFGWINDGFALDLMSRYFINYLPVDVRPADVVAIAATAFVLCLASTAYPARRAAGLLPRRVLAHE